MASEGRIVTGQGRGDYALNFATTKELTAALAAKKISAARTDRPLHRAHRGARRQDQFRGGARLRARSRGGQGRRCGAGARRRPPAARHSDRHQGIVRCGRPADHLGRTCAEGFCAEGRRAHGRPRQGCRRDHPRQDQRALCARRLAELQRHLRHDQQSVGPRPLARRIVGRIVGRACRGFRAGVARLGHRRIAARAGALLRHLRPQADLEPDPAARPPAARHGSTHQRSRRGRADGAHAPPISNFCSTSRPIPTRRAPASRTGWRCRRHATPR